MKINIIIYIILNYSYWQTVLYINWQVKLFYLLALALFRLTKREKKTSLSNGWYLRQDEQRFLSPMDFTTMGWYGLFFQSNFFVPETSEVKEGILTLFLEVLPADDFSITGL